MSISEWSSFVSAIAACIGSIAAVVTAVIAGIALNTWKPKRIVALRDKFKASLMDYKATVDKIPDNIALDNPMHINYKNDLIFAKGQCQKAWSMADYKNNQRVGKYYTQLSVKQEQFTKYQISKQDLLDHCDQIIARLYD